MNIEGGLIGWLHARGAEWRLALRVTVAAVLAYAIATALSLPQGYWAVFTAIVVMQASVGGSVKTGIDWFVGTVGGAVFGVAIATLVPHENAYAMGSAIALAVIPTALLAALHASFRVAPLTAVIVVLGLNPDLSPFMSAFDRVLEIAVGSLTGIVVSLTVLPARAHGLAAAAAGEALGICAALLTTLLETIGAGASTDANEPLHNALRRALTRVETLTEEAARERASRLSAEPDTGPLARTLRRLRGDIVMINRTATAALPAEIAAKLAPSVLHIARADVGFLSLCAAALRDRTPPPSLDGVTTAMREYAACLAALRRDGMTIPLSDDDAGRLFALGFALEQLHQNFHDLASRTGELARVPA